MGGLIIISRDTGELTEDVEARYAPSLEVFAQKGLQLERRFVRERFLAYRYRKLNHVHDAHVEFPDGDFIFSTGTFIYGGRIGPEALRSFFDDCVANKPFEAECSGNFALVVYRRGELSLLTDYCGYYPVYRHDRARAVSNSLLALATVDRGRRIDAQSMYEYLLHGFFVGEETLFEGVRRMDSRKLWRVSPAIAGASRVPAFDPLPVSGGMGEVVEKVSAQLHDYFATLSRLFPGNIGSALSGGYDSRHMTALLLSVGEAPHLYVYGGPSSSDVLVAKNIAAGEGLELEHVDKRAFPKVTPEQFVSNMQRDFYFFDGIKPLGQMDDGSDMTTRLSRARKARLQLNGAGGEIYREIWNLSDRSIDLESFLKLRYDRGEYSYLRRPFDSQSYFSGFAEKVRHKLAIDRRLLMRREAEMLFPFLRNHFACANNLANSQISDSLLPFMESRFVYPSFDIPIQYKYCGRVHAALIRKASPSLARYQSDYGINFADPIPAAYRAKQLLHRHIPLAIRLLARRRRARKAAGKPYYLGDDYLSSAFESKSMAIEEFVDQGEIHDPEVLSRALSVELFLKHLR